MEKNKGLVEMLKSEENAKAVEELVASGKKESEAFVEVAAKLGYEVTVEELSRAIVADKELDDDELENVSGGMFWFGEDAPDGHEIGCFYLWYGKWEDYYSYRDTGRCVSEFSGAPIETTCCVD